MWRKSASIFLPPREQPLPLNPCVLPASHDRIFWISSSHHPCSCASVFPQTTVGGVRGFSPPSLVVLSVPSVPSVPPHFAKCGEKFFPHKSAARPLHSLFMKCECSSLFMNREQLSSCLLSRSKRTREPKLFVRLGVNPFTSELNPKPNSELIHPRHFSHRIVSPHTFLHIL